MVLVCTFSSVYAGDFTGVIKKVRVGDVSNVVRVDIVEDGTGSTKKLWINTNSTNFKFQYALILAMKTSGLNVRAFTEASNTASLAGDLASEGRITNIYYVE